jgi:hypothetical protein
MNLQIFLLILLTLGGTFASRILFIFPTPSKSHMIIAHSMATTLAERGHDVTMLSAFKLGKSVENFREILVPFDDEVLKKKMQEIFENPNQSIFKSLSWILNLNVDLSNKAIQLPEFQKVLKDEKFDLVIIGMFFNNFLLGFGDHFKCPTVMLSTASHMSITNSITGNPAEINAVPSMHMIPVDPTKMTFLERMQNFLMNGGELLMSAYINNRMKITYE